MKLIITMKSGRKFETEFSQNEMNKVLDTMISKNSKNFIGVGDTVGGTTSIVLATNEIESMQLLE